MQEKMMQYARENGFVNVDDKNRYLNVDPVNDSALHDCI